MAQERRDEGYCEHCGSAGDHYPGCIMDALGFLALDEDEYPDGYSQDISDVRGLFGG